MLSLKNYTRGKEKMIKVTKKKIIPYSITGTAILLALKALYDYAASQRTGEDVMNLYASVNVSALYFPETWMYVIRVFVIALIIVSLIYLLQHPPEPPQWLKKLFQ